MKSLFIDKNFKNGISVQGTDIAATGADYVGFLDYGGESENAEPIWFITQFGSRFDISKGDFEKIGEKHYRYTDKSKIFEVNTETGAFKMGITGSLEYDKPRIYGQSLAGLLITPSKVVENNLADMEKLVFDLDFCIEKAENKMSAEDYDEENHAAQFLFYFFVGDKLSDDWYFVGVPMYDNRKEFAAEWRQQDNPDQKETTGLFVYVPATKECYSEAIKIGEEKHLYLDMLNFIYKGLEYAKSAGFMRNTEKENLYIKGFNLGWEIPGTFDCLASVKEYDVLYELKNK